MGKFEYAPGIPGFGTKGVDGSAGSTGLSMYFTNLSGITDQPTLKTKILNNYILWSTTTPLPNGRAYQQGDLFVDSVGKIYVIDFNQYYKFRDTYTNFSASAYFQYSETDSDYGMHRYSNTFRYYLIDNVLSDTVGDYTTTPTTIYSIKPKNFNRIEYTDEGDNYNPFSVFIASDTCDNNSIAIVRDVVDNSFRIGNLDSNGIARNVNIKFDVDKLMVSKDVGKTFTQDTFAGTVVTNYEINANSLFDPLFNYNPASFRYDSSPGINSATIFWDKRDFLNTADTAVLNNVQASLFFYQRDTTYMYKTYSFAKVEASTRTMCFYNIDVSGQLDVSALDSDKTYGMYMTFYNNGWTRNSVLKNVYPGVVPVLYIQDPCLGNIVTDASGIVTLTGMSYTSKNGFVVDISTNIASDITITKDKDWITLSTDTPSGWPIPTLVDVSINQTTSHTTETATILYHSAAADACIYVTRSGVPTPVLLHSTFKSTENSNYNWHIETESAWYIYVDNMPLNTVVDISIFLNSTVNNNNSAKNVNYNNTATLYTGDTLLNTKTFAKSIGYATVDISSGWLECEAILPSYLPLILVLNTQADSLSDVVNSYNTAFSFDDIKIKFFSGDAITTSYGDVDGDVGAVYPY
jgi:hypothetical protein